MPQPQITQNLRDAIRTLTKLVESGNAFDDVFLTLPKAQDLLSALPESVVEAAQHPALADVVRDTEHRVEAAKTLRLDDTVVVTVANLKALLYYAKGAEA